MIVKMTILRLLGSSDDKKKIDVARPVKKSKSKKSGQRYFSSTGRTDAIGIGASDGCRMIRWPSF